MQSVLTTLTSRVKRNTSSSFWGERSENDWKDEEAAFAWESEERKHRRSSRNSRSKSRARGESALKRLVKDVGIFYVFLNLTFELRNWTCQYIYDEESMQKVSRRYAIYTAGYFRRLLIQLFHVFMYNFYTSLLRCRLCLSLKISWLFLCTTCMHTRL